MPFVLVWVMGVALGAYVAAIAAAIGGTPLAQIMANVVGLGCMVVAAVTVGQWAVDQREK